MAGAKRPPKHTRADANIIEQAKMLLEENGEMSGNITEGKVQITIYTGRL